MNETGDFMQQSMQMIYQDTPQKEPKRKKRGLVIIPLLLLLVLAIFAVMYNMPKARLNRGFRNLVKEMNNANPVIRDLKYEDIQKLCEKNPYTRSMDITIKLPWSEELSNLNFAVDATFEQEKEVSSYDFAIGAYQWDFLKGNVILQKDKMFFSIPDYLQDVYFVEYENFGKNFNKSEWSKILELELDEEFLERYEKDTEQNLQDEFIQKYKTEVQKLIEENKDSVKYSNLDKTKSFKIDGKKKSYGGIRLTIEKELLNEMIELYVETLYESEYYEKLTGSDEVPDEYWEEFFDIRFENDVKINFYMDSRSHFVGIETEKAIAFEETELEKMEFEISFLGNKNRIDETKLEWNIASEYENYSVSFVKSAKTTKKAYEDSWTLTYQEMKNKSKMVLSYKNTWNMKKKDFDGILKLAADDITFTIKADGEFLDTQSGEGIMLDLGNVRLLQDEEELLSISGDFSIDVAEEEIKIPEEAVNFFEMSSPDIYGFLNEIESVTNGAEFY